MASISSFDLEVTSQIVKVAVLLGDITWSSLSKTFQTIPAEILGDVLKTFEKDLAQEFGACMA